MLLSFIKLLGCSIIATALLITAGCKDVNEQDTFIQNKKTIQHQKQVVNSSEEEPENRPQPFKSKTSDPIADVYLNTNPKSLPQENAFNCDDQIYLTIKFANHQPKLHQINISWKDPNGTERENNSFPFFVTEKESLAWASLKLHRSVGAGMLQWINPAAGMEEFIGTWSVDVKVQGLLNKTLNFEVLC